MSGFVTIERNLWDHPVFAPGPMTEREAWMWMIARAAWAETKHRVGADVVVVQRGSFMVTLREMQSEFMWGSDKKVRNFLRKLENHGMLTVLTLGQRNARKTHVTICNYEEYQSSGRSKDAAKTHGGRSKDAVNKQGNKGTIEDTVVSSMPSATKKRATRLPENWALPRDWGEWALSEGWAETTVRAEAEKFRDFWVSKPGRDGTKLDWQATWRNWMRNSKSPKVINGGSHGKPSGEPERVQRIIAAAAAGSSGKDWG